MPDTNTTFLNLTKPEVGASFDSWGNKLNVNADSIDDAFSGVTAIKPKLTDASEGVAQLTGTELTAEDGHMLWKTISANTAFTDGLTSGQRIRLRITDGDSYDVTWPAGIVWIGTDDVEPVLDPLTVLIFEKEGAVLYGYYAGGSNL